jgi:transposase InsO family protein
MTSGGKRYTDRLHAEATRSERASTVEAVQEWIAAAGAKTAYIERGSPWENGYIESFNARIRDQLLNGEIFYTLREAQIVIESWRRHYNTIRGIVPR